MSLSWLGFMSLRATEARIPLGRYATAQGANTALFLPSDRASYVAGAMVAMDGALTPGPYVS